MTITQSQQPEALRLADVLEKMPGYDWNKTYCEAAFQLRHIQHQNECLTAEIEKQRTARIEAQTENEELKAEPPLWFSAPHGRPAVCACCCRRGCGCGA